MHNAGYVKWYLGDTSSPLSYARYDPSNVPEIQQALVETRERRRDLEESSVSPIFRGPVDCFRRLPPEVLEYIQTLLQPCDVVNVRMASRSFASLPLSQSFWASRFNSRHERGYCI